MIAQEHAHSGVDPHVEVPGVGGRPDHAIRTIEVRMSDDMRFSPARIEVRRGETVRFHVTNTGVLEHEMVLGDSAALARHAREMRAAAQGSPGSHVGSPHQSAASHAHEDTKATAAIPRAHGHPGAAVMVAPGRTADLIWRFTPSGQVQFACLVPGHYEAGMAGTIAVR